MDYITFFFYVILSLIITTFIQRLYDIYQKRPPGPIGLPFVGRLPFIIFKTIFVHNGNLFDALAFEGASYGDVRFLRVGTRHVLTLSSVEALAEALHRHPEGFTTRPTLDYFFIHRQVAFYHDKSKPKFGGGLLYANEPIWKENRRFTLRVLREFGMGKNMVEAKVQLECRNLINELSKPASSLNNPNMHFTKAVTNIICQVVFGYRLGYEDIEFDHQITLMKELVQSYGLLLFLPIFFKFLENETYYKLANVDRFIGLDGKLINYIGRKVKEVEDKYNFIDEPTNFVEMYLRKNTEEVEKEATPFSREQLTMAVVDLFIAGTDTTTNAVNWAIINAAYYQDWQQEIYDELDEQVGDRTDLSYADRLRCPKTQAFLDEVFRLFAAVPHNVERETDREIWFRNGRISPKTYIIADIRAAHLNPDTWDNPTEFRPQRFLNDKNEYQPSSNMIVFSVGKRQCLGEGMARVEFFLFFASVVRHFHLELSEESKRKGKDIFLGTDGLINAPLEHVINFTERHTNN